MATQVRVGDSRHEQQEEELRRAPGKNRQALGLSAGKSEEGRLGIWELLNP